MGALVLALFLASSPQSSDLSFPLPTEGSRTLAQREGETTWRLPWRFERVERFYLERFAHRPEVRVERGHDEKGPLLIIRQSAKGASWAKATVRELEVGTRIDLVPVVRMAETQVEGNGRPLVEFVMGRSPDAAKMAEEIDHTVP